MSDEIEKSQKKGNGAYIAIILILLIAVGGMTYLWSSTDKKLTDASNTIKQQNADMEAMNDMLADYVGDMSNDLRTDFMRMLSDYDELKKNGTPAQNEEIAKQQQEIQKLLDELNSSKKINASTIARLRRENDELRSIMRGYVYEIDSLNTLNLSLRNDLDDKTTKLAKTTEERDTYQQKADALDEKVKAGQKLVVISSSFSSMAMKQSILNEMKETNRAKNAVQIQSSFTIGKNAITDPGEKTVYMQIVGPDNKTLQNSFSGVVETESGNVPYSNKRSIDYQNQSIDVTMFYGLRNEELDKGNYKINIYCQGQLIGTDSFTLK